MNKCKNCGNDVKNKFCGTKCLNEFKGKENERLYYLNSNRCFHCNNEIPYDKRYNKFCSHECSTTSNNTGLERNIISKLTDLEIIDYHSKSSTLSEFYGRLGYAKRPTTKGFSVLCSRLNDLGLSFDKLKREPLNLKTKGDLFSSRKNWQSARSSIAKHSREVYMDSTKPKSCLKCGYDKHIEICHVNSVSEFSNDTLIGEINSIDNLIALCPNHHWEFDNLGSNFKIC